MKNTWIAIFYGAAATVLASVVSAQNFTIEIIRTETLAMSHYTTDGRSITVQAVIGDVGLNGQNIGRTVENRDLLIPAGTYKGVLRYVSSRNFVAGPMGAIGTVGDLLIEIGGVPNRSDILIHGGDKPWQSRGCILLGAIPKSDGVPFLPDKHPLSVLRRAFYGTDTPNASPNMPIQIIISDNR